MSDFKAALTEGFEAAHKAELAQKEVQDVLARLKRDILEASDGELLIEVRQLTKHPPIDWGSTLASAATRSWFDPTSILGITSALVRYQALVAANPNCEGGKTAKELATWKQSKEGYPCTLSWDSRERQCHDQLALEECLADLLRDANTAEILLSVRRMGSANS